MKKTEYYSLLEDISLIDKYDEKINVVMQLEEWFGKDCSLKDAEDALWFNKLEVSKRIENQLNIEQLITSTNETARSIPNKNLKN